LYPLKKETDAIDTEDIDDMLLADLPVINPIKSAY
jgi:hypothetical protein